MMKNPQAYPTLLRSLEAGIDDIERRGNYVLPSSHQGRLDKVGVPLSNEEVEQLRSSPSSVEGPHTLCEGT
jgi:hypothetical protein